MVERADIPAPLILASRSPRRAELLREAGFALEVMNPPYADPPPVASPDGPVDGQAYAVATAAAKLRSWADSVQWGDSGERAGGVALSADTVCVGRRDLLGKPADRAKAAAMLRGFVGRSHEVVSGCGVWHAGEIHTLVDTATVSWGEVGDDAIEAYLDTEAWRDKAGGYNLFDRQAAGWPIAVAGDPATVVGLPMRRLIPWLAEFGVKPSGRAVGPA